MYFLNSSKRIYCIYKYAQKNYIGIIRKLHETAGLRSRLPRIDSSSLNASGKQLKDAAGRDNVPEGFQLIYKAPMQSYVNASKNITSLTAAVMLALAAYQYKQNAGIRPELQPELELGKLVTRQEDLKYFALGFVAISLALQIIVAKYPLRIYKNAENYIAVYNSKIPLGNLHHHSFKKGDVSDIQSKFNPWQDIYFRLGNKTSFLFHRCFRTPSEFNEMFTKL